MADEERITGWKGYGVAVTTDAAQLNWSAHPRFDSSTKAAAWVALMTPATGRDYCVCQISTKHSYENDEWKSAVTGVDRILKADEFDLPKDQQEALNILGGEKLLPRLLRMAELSEIEEKAFSRRKKL